MKNLRASRVALWAERALLAVGVLLLAGRAAVWVEARVYGFVQDRRLDRMAYMHKLSAASGAASGATTVPSAPGRRAKPVSLSRADAPPLDGDLVGRIEVPRLRLRAIIAEGVDARTLRRAVGHLPGTPLPGDSGNVVIAGHRDTLFRGLQDVQTEDIVRVTTALGRFEYVVERVEVVEPSRLEVLADSGEPSITLVTCYPFYLVGNAPERFVVRARQVFPPPSSPTL